jgi:hypothetical protein
MEKTTKKAIVSIPQDPLRAAYVRFKHRDTFLEEVRDYDGTEESNPFGQTARDLWRAIKASLGHMKKANVQRFSRSERALLAHALLHLEANKIADVSLNRGWYNGNKEMFIGRHIRAVAFLRSLTGKEVEEKNEKGGDNEKTN